jgi:hypothetical protein
MKLLEARVNGDPRRVNTKYGEKSVVDFSTAEGDFTLWKQAGDPTVMSLHSGEIVAIVLDANGKPNLVDRTPPQTLSPTPQPAQRVSPPVPSSHSPTALHSRRVEIADYVQRCSRLYQHCLDTAANIPNTLDLEPPQVKDIATTLFLQAVKHFDL